MAQRGPPVSGHTSQRWLSRLQQMGERSEPAAASCSGVSRASSVQGQAISIPSVLQGANLTVGPPVGSWLRRRAAWGASRLRRCGTAAAREAGGRDATAQECTLAMASQSTGTWRLTLPRPGEGLLGGRQGRQGGRGGRRAVPAGAQVGLEGPSALCSLAAGSDGL